METLDSTTTRKSRGSVFQSITRSPATSKTFGNLLLPLTSKRGRQRSHSGRGIFLSASKVDPASQRDTIVKQSGGDIFVVASAPMPNKERLKAECSIISKVAAVAGVARTELKKPLPTNQRSGKTRSLPESDSPPATTLRTRRSRHMYRRNGNTGKRNRSGRYRRTRSPG